MRAVLQRVSSASVTIGGTTKARIAAGLLVLVAVEDADTLETSNGWRLLDVGG